MEEMAEEVLELKNLALLGEDKFGLEIHFMSTDDNNYPAP